MAVLESRVGTQQQKGESPSAATAWEYNENGWCGLVCVSGLSAQTGQIQLGAWCHRCFEFNVCIVSCTCWGNAGVPYHANFFTAPSAHKLVRRLRVGRFPQSLPTQLRPHLDEFCSCWCQVTWYRLAAYVWELSAWFPMCYGIWGNLDKSNGICLSSLRSDRSNGI